ncbi:DUF6095 family protein [Polaribacter porphyrae]|uniref:Uncharacterized protein n=1 Tax=Polaribacter porphyrae TaxID=1137780 RepID=A0A2S7WL29_9FLAO|nr:DUF6095 family protein [Polaribacter porphyrae]PQJ78011.1 hypothetical protein BTO18_01875 [Polaribacter porphyrae]
MSTDTDLLRKGLFRLGILILLFIASPIIITMSFKALDKFTEAPKIYFAYAFIGIGCLLLIFTVYFAFKTFGVIQKAIFNKD